MQVVVTMLIGIIAGTLSGMFGIGGGVVIVPALVLMLGYSQHRAQGTSIATLLAPVGIFGAIVYSKSKDIDYLAAGIMAIGLLIGIFAGAKLSVSLNEATLRKSFAIFLGFVAVIVYFKKS